MRKLRPIVGLLGAVVLLLVFLYFSEAPPAGALPVTSIGANFEPLRAAFNADAGKVRLLMLLDPT